jgi:hypothetical protein
MAKLSLSRAWEESSVVLQHDGKLLTIVALALIALPSTVQSMITPPASQGELPAPGPWIAVAIAALIIGIIGQLAIIRLAVGPHTTVGEAIGHGARRTPTYFAAVVIWILPIAIATVFLIEGMRGGKPSAAAALGFVVLMLAVIFFVVRFILMPPVASAEAVGPVAILRRSWALTRGNWWRLFAFLLLFIIAAFCLVIASEVVVGSVVTLILGTPEHMSVGALIIALVTQLLIAALSVVYFVMVARMYLQLSGGGETVATVPSSGI